MNKDKEIVSEDKLEYTDRVNSDLSIGDPGDEQEEEDEEQPSDIINW